MGKRLDDTFLAFNFPKLWELDDDCCEVTFLTQRQKAAILHAIRYTLWPSRWFNDNGINLLRDVNPTELETALTWAERMHSDIMANCTSEIYDGLHELAEAIKNKTFGGGDCPSTNCGTTTITVTPGGTVVTGENVDTGVENEGTGDPPDGYASWEEYFAHKCRVANALVDGFEQELRTLSTVTIISFVTVSATLGLAWAAFPPAAIVILVVAIAALGIANFYLLPQLADAIEARREEFVCGLYNSATAGVAIDEFLTHMDDAIEDLALMAPLPTLLKAVAIALCDTGVFSKLFDATIDFYYASADCSGCNESTPAFVINGFGVITNGDASLGTPTTITSQYGSAFGAMQEIIRLSSTPDGTNLVYYVEMLDAHGFTAFTVDGLDENGGYFNVDNFSVSLFPLTRTARPYNFYSRPDGIQNTFTIRVTATAAA